jgi:hypothetical protein
LRIIGGYDFYPSTLPQHHLRPTPPRGARAGWPGRDLAARAPRRRGAPDPLVTHVARAHRLEIRLEAGRAAQGLVDVRVAAARPVREESG